MTQHIEEARKVLHGIMESVGAEEIRDLDSGLAIATGIAAAEERGRSEERERCTQIARGLFKQETDGTNAAFCGLLISNAITKEPTP